jgi:hypothetical protein
VGPGWLSVITNANERYAGASAAINTCAQSESRCAGFIASPWLREEATLTNVIHYGTEDRPSYQYGGVPAGGALPMPLQLAWSDLLHVEPLSAAPTAVYATQEYAMQGQVQVQAQALKQQQAAASYAHLQQQAVAFAAAHATAAFRPVAASVAAKALPPAERRELKGAAPVAPARAPPASGPLAAPRTAALAAQAGAQELMLFGSYVASAEPDVVEPQPLSSTSLASAAQRLTVSGRPAQAPAAQPLQPEAAPSASTAAAAGKVAPKPRCSSAAPAAVAAKADVTGDSEESKQLVSQIDRLKARAASAEAEVERLHEAATCTVCLDAPRSLLLLPCAHFPLCSSPACLKMLSGACPLCRKAVLRTQKVFL